MKPRWAVAIVALSTIPLGCCGQVSVDVWLRGGDVFGSIHTTDGSPVYRLYADPAADAFPRIQPVSNVEFGDRRRDGTVPSQQWISYESAASPAEIQTAIEQYVTDNALNASGDKTWRKGCTLFKGEVTVAVCIVGQDLDFTAYLD